MPLLDRVESADMATWRVESADMATIFLESADTAVKSPVIAF